MAYPTSHDWVILTFMQSPHRASQTDRFSLTLMTIPSTSPRAFSNPTLRDLSLPNSNSKTSNHILMIAQRLAATDASRTIPRVRVSQVLSGLWEPQNERRTAQPPFAFPELRKNSCLEAKRIAWPCFKITTALL